MTSTPISRPTLTARSATSRDAAVLGQLNHELIEDEGHQPRVSAADLARILGRLLEADDEAVLFYQVGEDTPAAYALYRITGHEVRLRHFFVARHCRRRGIGRAAISKLRLDFWPEDARILVEALSSNPRGLAFWRALGFVDYSVIMQLDGEFSPDPPER